MITTFLFYSWCLVLVSLYYYYGAYGGICQVQSDLFHCGFSQNLGEKLVYLKLDKS
jgi:hypothetical protein